VGLGAAGVGPVGLGAAGVGPVGLVGPGEQLGAGRGATRKAGLCEELTSRGRGAAGTPSRPASALKRSQPSFSMMSSLTL